MPALAFEWADIASPVALEWAGPGGGTAAARARLPVGAIAAIIGPPGPAGPIGPGGGATRIDASLASTWTLPHLLGRIPAVQVFIGLGEMVIADVFADAAQVTITHSDPRSGFVLVL